jgi:hypothetical protein
MDIKGMITGIKYQTFLQKELQTVDFNNFNVNTVYPSCIVRNKNHYEKIL